MNATFFASALFPAVTSFYWPWWRTEWGWNLVVLDLALAVAVFPTLLALDFGIRAQVFYWAQVTGLSVVALVIPWRTFMIWRAQRAGTVRGKSREGTGSLREEDPG